MNYTTYTVAARGKLPRSAQKAQGRAKGFRATENCFSLCPLMGFLS